MIWLVTIRDGGSGSVEGLERCEVCMCRAHYAVGQEAELRGPRARFEGVFIVMTVQVD